jgi:hypothetical protein
MSLAAPTPRRSHIWARADSDWYQEPPWCAERLFDVEIFIGEVIDPACGGGNIIKAARARHLPAEGWDIVDRGFPETVMRDFLSDAIPPPRPQNFVFNPPFALAQPFTERAIELAKHKVATIFPTRRLNAAKWLQRLPLARVWLLTPRPSMPPGEMIQRGKRSGGGKVDFVWLVFERDYPGSPSLRWLNRDHKEPIA